MKTAVVLTCLLAALAISAQAGVPKPVVPISLSSLIVTGTNAADSNVTVKVLITTDYSAYGDVQVTLNIMSTNGLIGQLFPSEIITNFPIILGLKSGVPKGQSSCIWTNTSWDPYFAGDFVVTVTAVHTSGLNLPVVGATTVTVVRTIGGTMNSVKVPVDVSAIAYDVNMAFTNICVTQVFLIDGGLMPAAAVADSIPLTLVNYNIPPWTNGMTDEQYDRGVRDIGAYRATDTPFRFDMDLHKRPTSFTGFGEIKHFVWTPDAATNPAGRGNLKVDIVSCQPWRSGYTTNFQATIGCAPLFITDTNVAAKMKGMIMSTTACDADVIPSISADGRIGLQVNGNSNSASYFEVFIPDTTLLDSWGVPSVDMITNMVAGYVTHYNFNTNSEGTAVMTPTFNPIAGGGTNYAYNSTNGDSGYEVTLNFEFHSPVAAQIGLRANVFGDYDGDGVSDLAVYNAGYWSIYSLANGMILNNGGA